MNDIFEYQLKKLFLHSLMPNNARMLEILSDWYNKVEFDNNIVTIYHREVTYKYLLELRESKYVNKIIVIE